jgi:CubicO group peptidase (beta-lactamase class C family)
MTLRPRWIGFFLALSMPGCSDDAPPSEGSPVVAVEPDAGGDGDSAPTPCDAVPVQTGDTRFDALLQKLEIWRADPEAAVTSVGIAIVEDGKATHRAVLGRAHSDTCEPLTDRHVFHLHAMSGLFTTVAAARSGKLAPDAPIGQYIPELTWCPAEDGSEPLTTTLWKDQVTIERLLTQTSGFSPGPKLQCLGPDGYYDDPANCATVGFEPGTAWVRGDRAAVALAVALGNVLGLPFREVMRQDLFEPLGMEETTYDPPPDLAFQTPVPTGISGDACAESLAEYSAFSTLRDVHRFAEAVLQPELIDHVFPPGVEGFAPDSRGAIWLRTLPLPGTGTLALHMGAGWAYGGYWLFIPEQRFAAVMTGASTQWPSEVKDVVNMVLDAYGFGSTPYGRRAPGPVPSPRRTCRSSSPWSRAR